MRPATDLAPGADGERCPGCGQHEKADHQGHPSAPTVEGAACERPGEDDRDRPRDQRQAGRGGARPDHQQEEEGQQEAEPHLDHAGDHLADVRGEEVEARRAGPVDGVVRSTRARQPPRGRPIASGAERRPARDPDPGRARRAPRCRLGPSAVASGKTVLTMATDVGIISAAPVPWATRAAIIHGMSWPARRAWSPRRRGSPRGRKTRRRPNMSPRRPPRTMNAASGRMFAVSTHGPWSIWPPRSSTTCGVASGTAVWSTRIMLADSVIATRVMVSAPLELASPRARRQRMPGSLRPLLRWARVRARAPRVRAVRGVRSHGASRRAPLGLRDAERRVAPGLRALQDLGGGGGVASTRAGGAVAEGPERPSRTRALRERLSRAAEQARPRGAEAGQADEADEANEHAEQPRRRRRLFVERAPEEGDHERVRARPGPDRSRRRGRQTRIRSPGARPTASTPARRGGRSPASRARSVSPRPRSRSRTGPATPR